jgi:hypothetical protein
MDKHSRAASILPRIKTRTHILHNSKLWCYSFIFVGRIIKSAAKGKPQRNIQHNSKLWYYSFASILMYKLNPSQILSTIVSHWISVEKVLVKKKAPVTQTSNTRMPFRNCHGSKTPHPTNFHCTWCIKLKTDMCKISWKYIDDHFCKVWLHNDILPLLTATVQSIVYSNYMRETLHDIW